MMTKERSKRRSDFLPLLFTISSFFSLRFCGKHSHLLIPTHLVVACMAGRERERREIRRARHARREGEGLGKGSILELVHQSSDFTVAFVVIGQSKLLWLWFYCSEMKERETDRPVHDAV